MYKIAEKYFKDHAEELDGLDDIDKAAIFSSWITLKLQGALREAIKEVREHNSEYHHNTASAQIDDWEDLIK